jgi:predicted transcriptional regulator
MKYKVEGHSNLYRDQKTGAIINSNSTEYNNYVQDRISKINNNQRLEDLENNVQNMRNDLEEIKSLLRGLSNGS